MKMNKTKKDKKNRVKIPEFLNTPYFLALWIWMAGARENVGDLHLRHAGHQTVRGAKWGGCSKRFSNFCKKRSFRCNKTSIFKNLFLEGSSDWEGLQKHNVMETAETNWGHVKKTH